MVENSEQPRAKRAARSMTIIQFSEGIIAFLVLAALIGVLAAGFLLPVVGAAGAAVKAGPASFDEIPSDLELVTPAEESRMLDADGNEITRFYSQRRIIVASDQIAQVMKDAIVSVEDRRFYEHHGVDPDGLARAAINNLGGNATQGASTITQQYVKNMLVERGIQAGDQDLIDEAQEQSTERKLREVRYAMGLEARMTKDEILTGYLNIAPFGPTVYGVEAAARQYFSQSASDLSLAQAALLAGITNSPVEYNPLVNPEKAQERRDVVLRSMLDEDKITRDEYNEAKAMNVVDYLKPDNRTEGCIGATGSMGYFCTYALEELLSDPAYGETRAERLHLLETGGLVIRTTIKPKLQADAWNTVTGTVPVMDESGVNTAIVSVVPQTGQIVAMAQNTNFGPPTEAEPRNSEVNFNVYQNRGGGTGFQPGSTMKVFTLAQWFKEGKGAYDSVGSNNRDYPAGSLKCPSNPDFYTGDFRFDDLAGKDGPHSVLDTMKLSINQGIASMASQVDYCQIFQRAAEAGVVDVDGNALSPNNPSQMIGGDTGVSPLAMATAYATIANNGIRCQATALTEVSDRDGNPIKTYTPNCTQAWDTKVANQVATVLKQVANSYDVYLSRQFGAKTGTTDDNANTWMVGFVPQLATAAWVGTAQNSSRPIQNMWINGQYYDSIYGGTFVGPIWTTYMEEAITGTEVINIPDVWIGNKPLPLPVPKTEEEKKESDQTPTNQGNQGNNQNNPGQGTGGEQDDD
ncbi:transglycosylase domain-containing protein [Scrofimicrobium sp. R131]|uniref:Transglycosylase domain-containing protein n=1 Tax=Scrofimicrobium appendicitidis TaxID=3079930 RepID=A0AAU7V7Q1_9ACTO